MIINYNKLMKLLTPQEVADMLGVKRSTVWRWVRHGRLKVIKLTGRSYRIDEEDLKKFLNERKTK